MEGGESQLTTSSSSFIFNFREVLSHLFLSSLNLPLPLTRFSRSLRSLPQLVPQEALSMTLQLNSWHRQTRLLFQLLLLIRLPQR